MKKTEVRFIRTAPGAKAPYYASEGAAGADLCACTETATTVRPGETVMIPTGIAIEIPSGLAGFVFARSGLASKRGLAPANKVGVIDSDYRGEILVAIHNHSAADAVIEPGERIAQLVLMPVVRAAFTEAEGLSGTARGEGGFGSTGKK